MARDDMARDTDAEQSLPDHHSNLRPARSAASSGTDSFAVPAGANFPSIRSFTTPSSSDIFTGVEVQDGS